jgi:sulfite exporter TauE/SafE
VLLGLVSGPACIASCGPLLVPWCIERGQRVKQNAAQLGAFVAARFCGYMVFAAGAFALGKALPSPSSARSLAYGIVHVALGVALALYAIGRWRRAGCAAAGSKPQLVTIVASRSPSRIWVPLLGFLTGFSLCPPFLVAGMRVMEFASFALALLFFTLFLAGTLIWFVPFLTVGFVKWGEPAMFVARITLLLLSCYYAYLGFVILIGRSLHG